ncbi:hypothetical protein ABPG74_006527 [Tetrahymena malaccensis]
MEEQIDQQNEEQSQEKQQNQQQINVVQPLDQGVGNSKSSVNLDTQEQKSSQNQESLSENVERIQAQEIINQKYKMENYLVGGGHTFLFQRNNVNEQNQSEIDQIKEEDENKKQNESTEDQEKKIQIEQNEKLLKEQEDITSQILSGNLRLVHFSKKIPRYIPWLVLSISVILGASIPTSILVIDASRYVKAFWRFQMTVFWIIPFCIYEYFDASYQRYYKCAYIFQLDNLKQSYISSLGSSIWFTFILFSFDYTSVSHAMLLGSLSNFFMSAIRTFKRGSKKIELEVVGLTLVIIGVLLVFVDSITMDELQSDKRYQGFDMVDFLNKPWWVRIIVGDFLCLLTSFIVCRFGMLKKDDQMIYPTYLNLLIMSIFTAMNMFLVSLVTGCTFSRDPDGVFALFTLKYFFIYLAIALFSGLGLFLSYIYISKFFEPIVSASAYLFEPIVATILIYMFNIEFLPGPFACLGYVFVLPGQFLILLTRHLIQVRMNTLKQKQLQAQEKEQVKQQ